MRILVKSWGHKFWVKNPKKIDFWEKKAASDTGLKGSKIVWIVKRVED